MHIACANAALLRPVFGCFVVVIGLLVASPVLAQLSDADIAALEKRAIEEGWTFGVGPNPATDYDLSELCGLRPPPDWGTEAPVEDYQPTRDLPASFDWRDVTGCPPVRNQASCGSCWAFGTVGAFECAIMIRDNVEADLSEQWLVSCNQDGWGCEGGWWAHNYHTGLREDPCGGSGAVMEDECPYAAADLPCGCPYPHEYWLDSWGYVYQSGVAQPWQIKQAILEHGPISVGVAVDDAFQAYNGGIFNACTATELNHAIVLVGWEDDESGYSGVWILRNSWGPNWGEDGYMRIRYGCDRVGYGSCWVDYGGKGLTPTPYTGCDVEGPVGGPFTPESTTYTVENNAASSINYAVSADVDWLTVSGGSGSLAAGGTADVTISLSAQANSLPAGDYTATISFVNQTSHIGDTQRTFSLTVGTTPLQISFPSGVPAYFVPGVATDIDVQIIEDTESLADGSAYVHYRYQGGEFVSAPLTLVSGNYYLATLPPANCADGPEFYFSAETEGGTLVTRPSTAPTDIYAAAVAEVAAFFVDNFETDQGWTAENLGASSGDWQRGVPVNDPSWDYDPETDGDGSGQCYLTQNETGNTDVDDGAVRLTSPTIDLAGAFNVELHYEYFLRLTDDDGNDFLLLEVDPNGGGTWTEIARHDTDGGLEWRSHTITQADLAAAGVPLTGAMRFRFTTNDADSQSINESGIDGFLIYGMGCVNPPQYDVIVTTVGNGTVTLDPSDGSYFADVTVTLEAVADAGWEFDHWEGALSGAVNPDTLLIAGDANVTAVFVEFADCNDNGVPDDEDIGTGTSLDTNGNGIPDECECPGDLDGTGNVDLADLQLLLGNYGQTGVTYEDGDFDGDGDVDLSDLQELLGYYGTLCD